MAFHQLYTLPQQGGCNSQTANRNPDVPENGEEDDGFWKFKGLATLINTKLRDSLNPFGGMAQNPKKKGMDSFPSKGKTKEMNFI